MEIRIPKEQLELRSCNGTLTPKEPHTTAEIVQWNTDSAEPYCITIAYWTRDSEGYCLKLVGNRALDVQIEDFWPLVKAGQAFLDEYFNIMSDL